MPPRRTRTSTNTSVPSASSSNQVDFAAAARAAARHSIIALENAQPARLEIALRQRLAGASGGRARRRAVVRRRPRCAFVLLTQGQAIVSDHSLPAVRRRRPRGRRRPAPDAADGRRRGRPAGLPARLPLRGGHAHRQPRRHQPARAARARAGGRHRLRGYAHQRRLPAAFRPRKAAVGAARAQRARRRRAGVRAAGRGRARGLHQRRRHAGRVRPGRGAGAGRGRRRLSRDAAARRQQRDHRAERGGRHRGATASRSPASSPARRRSGPTELGAPEGRAPVDGDLRGAASHRGAGRARWARCWAAATRRAGSPCAAS